MRTQLAYYKISFIDKIAQTLKKIKTCISQGDTSNNSSVPRGAHETSRRMAQVSPSPGPASLALPPGQAQPHAETRDELDGLLPQERLWSPPFSPPQKTPPTSIQIQPGPSVPVLLSPAPKIRRSLA